MALRVHRPALHVVAVEPAESAVLSGGLTGSNRIEGIGIGFIPPLWEPDQVDEIQQVSHRLNCTDPDQYLDTTRGASFRCLGRSEQIEQLWERAPRRARQRKIIEIVEADGLPY